jgi:hypothetical protein
MSVVTGSVLLSSSAAAAPSAPWHELTGSERGHAAARRAAALFEASDVPTRQADLKVFDAGNGDVLVVPRWVSPDTFRSRGVTRGGRPAVEVEASVIVGLLGGKGRSTAGLDGQVASADGAAVAAAPYWSQYESGCFAWMRNGGSYLAPCYYISKLINDGSSTRDYFALRQKASIGTDRWGSGNYDGWLMSARTSGSTTQYWEEWEPAGELHGNCGTVNLSVMVKGVTLGISSTACERWEPTLWPDAGHFRNKWNCDCWIGVAGMRQVASNIAVSVAQGKWPRWTLWAGFTGF